MKLSRTYRIFALLSALLPASVYVAGCGGGSAPQLPSPANYVADADLVYFGVPQNSNAYTADVASLATSGGNFTGEFVNRNNEQNLTFSGVNRIVNVATERRFVVQLASPAGQPFQSGQIIPLALGTQSNILLRQSNANIAGDRIWTTDGGTATVTAIGADSIALRLENARFVPSSAFFGRGTFLLNGTLSAAGLRVVAG